jgi:hypothetical protein
MRITNITIAGDYTLDEMNSGFAFVDSMLRRIDTLVSHSASGIGTSWERGAVKRFVASELQGLTKVRQCGNYAAAKIGVGKAETFEQLKAALNKLVVKG